ncbi:hypothetical protein C8R41DRAFT_915811 [Lentinula lateritia]|uniref:Uncharacterized protein n=1 Tax=Lentinula lateritia TaxID=40482 RepID=A0ABQ8VS08_9AGAR|nr:hypothetical protein C8R41DRAFT_915811 [Lentinula lateritia]
MPRLCVIFIIFALILGVISSPVVHHNIASSVRLEGRVGETHTSLTDIPVKLMRETPFFNRTSRQTGWRLIGRNPRGANSNVGQYPDQKFSRERWTLFIGIDGFRVIRDSSGNLTPTRFSIPRKNAKRPNRSQPEAKSLPMLGAKVFFGDKRLKEMFFLELLEKPLDPSVRSNLDYLNHIVQIMLKRKMLYPWITQKDAALVPLDKSPAVWTEYLKKMYSVGGNAEGDDRGITC